MTRPVLIQAKFLAMTMTQINNAFCGRNSPLHVSSLRWNFFGSCSERDNPMESTKNCQTESESFGDFECGLIIIDQ